MLTRSLRRHQILLLAIASLVLHTVLTIWLVFLLIGFHPGSSNADAVTAPPSQNRHLVDDILAAWLLEAPPCPIRLFRKGARQRRTRLGGRLDRKPKEREEVSHDWTQHAFEKLGFVYMRFSTREQRERNAYSFERQEGLKRLAVQHGVRTELSPAEVARLKAQLDYLTLSMSCVSLQREVRVQENQTIRIA